MLRCRCGETGRRGDSRSSAPAYGPDFFLPRKSHLLTGWRAAVYCRLFGAGDGADLEGNSATQFKNNKPAWGQVRAATSARPVSLLTRQRVLPGAGADRLL